MQNRRFIAGAVCPRCGELDKIVRFQEADASGVLEYYRACVRCDFKERMAQENQDEQNIGKFSQPIVKSKVLPETQVLQFEPDKSTK